MENNIEKIFLIMKNINKQHHIFQLGELEEEEKNINDLQDILKKLDVLLSCIDKKFISGYSIEELKDDMFLLHLILDALEWQYDQIHEMVNKVSIFTLPPNVKEEDALALKDSVILALKDSTILESKNSIEIYENDIYFIEAIKNKFIINDNYKGIMIFDNKLNLIKKMKLFKDLIIELSLKNENKLLLICPENDRIIYIDFDYYQYHTILLGDEFRDFIFSPLFEWDEDKIMLSDYNGNFAKLDLINLKINKINKNTSNLSIKKTYGKLNQLYVRKVFVLEKKAILENRSERLCLIDYTEDITPVIEIPKEEFHDFEIMNEYIAEIGEYKIIIPNIEKREIHKYFPEKGNRFLRGKFMVEGKRTVFYLLIEMEFNYKMRIEKYILCS